jgi:predicted nuclease with TOPRIM domain
MKTNTIKIGNQTFYDIASELYDYIKQIEQENKQLQERMEYLERSNNRREDIIIEQRQEISDLEDNWDELKEWVKEQPIFNYLAPVDIKNKMQELERGVSDDNH